MAFHHLGLKFLNEKEMSANLKAILKRFDEHMTDCRTCSFVTFLENYPTIGTCEMTLIMRDRKKPALCKKGKDLLLDIFA